MIIQDKFGRRINTDMMACDFCGKRVAVKGIKIRQLQADEYQVSFFSCPHCGHRFLALATDERQRELLAEQKRARGKVQIAIKRRYRKQTIGKYRRELLRVTDEARERNRFLSAVGSRLLAGDELSPELISECRTAAKNAGRKKESAADGTL